MKTLKKETQNLLFAGLMAASAVFTITMIKEAAESFKAWQSFEVDTCTEYCDNQPRYGVMASVYLLNNAEYQQYEYAFNSVAECEATTQLLRKMNYSSAVAIECYKST